VVLIGALVVAAIVNTRTVPPPVEAWHAAMTVGDPEAEKHFVVYTDVFCPYCDDFSRAWRGELAQFTEEYLDSKKVYLEYRLTDMVADHSPNAERGGEGAYCAADQGQAVFWGWYDAMLAQLLADYHSKGIGVSKTSPKIPELDNQYFYNVAAQVEGLDTARFRDCYDGHEQLAELNNRTSQAKPITSGGVPYFVFDKWTSSGFQGDYQTVRAMMQAGGA
jgi:hypothetical protein